MAYYGRRATNRRFVKKRKYSQAEQIAFRLGQEQRVKKSLSDSNTRVYEAYAKGLRGPEFANSSKKPLFSN